MRKTRKPKAAPRSPTPRGTKEQFDKLHNKNPPAMVGGKFIAQPGSFVQVWRERGGWRARWCRCRVVKVEEMFIELFDETLGQWFCFNPADLQCPDMRLTV